MSKPSTITEEQKEKILKLHAEGIKDSPIAKQLGLEYHQVYNVIKKIKPKKIESNLESGATRSVDDILADLDKALPGIVDEIAKAGILTVKQSYVRGNSCS